MPNSDHPPVLRTPGEGRTISLVGDLYRVLATGAETDGKYATFEALVPPGGGPPPHIHRREEESFYVLEGEIAFTVNGERVVAGPGTFASMPVGSLHTFRNESTRTARMLISVAPAGLEAMFLEVGTALPTGSTTDARSNVSQVGSVSTPLNFASQQQRAFKLAWTLDRSGLVEGRKVAVVSVDARARFRVGRPPER
jgi:quercetin dioxygenase-like cupin family protein